MLRQQGDPEGAKAAQARAEAITRTASNLQAATLATNTGVRLLEAGDLEGAVLQFRAALKLAPEFAPAHYHLARALRKSGKESAAQKEFQKAAELDPKYKAHGP